MSDEYRYSRLFTIVVIIIILSVSSGINIYSKLYFDHIQKMTEQGYEQVKDERTQTGTLWVKKGGTHESPN